MTTVFRNPPLIEMIAELRWSGQGQSTLPVIMPGANGPAEAMFLQWTARMGALGYEHVERLVPVGFPLPLDAPTLRVKQKTGMPQNTLFQLGPQLFTANATPPYLSWQDFAPTAREGLTALLAVRPEPEATAPFQAALRAGQPNTAAANGWALLIQAGISRFLPNHRYAGSPPPHSCAGPRAPRGCN